MGTVEATCAEQPRAVRHRAGDDFDGSTWADKPWIATSANGADVYIAWTTRGNLYAVNSHTAGSSWSTPLKVTNETGMYYYSNGGAVLPTGSPSGNTAVMVASEYPESGNATGATGLVPIVEFRTTNGGTSWTRTVVDTLNTGVTYETCSVTHCGIRYQRDAGPCL